MSSNEILIRRYPFLEDDPLALKVYIGFLYHTLRCPECNDRLYPAISRDDDGVYTVIYECMERTCNYTMDVSKVFNQQVGVVMPEPEPEPVAKSEDKLKLGHVPYHYHNLTEVKAYDDEVKELLKYMGECPECGGMKYQVVTKYNIESCKMDVICTCMNCYSQYDIEDYYDYYLSNVFGEPISQVTSLDDCEMRFVGKAWRPPVTGTLKKSF